MKSTLEIKKIRMMSAKMNGESSLPALEDYHGQYQENGNSLLGYDESLYVGYGNVSSVYPYRSQDLYSRKLYDTEIEVITLENDYLKATFYPHLGGKLASLCDKVRGRDLLYCNSVLRPCNLALRNAWMSGGVEFNCGILGHHPFTCSTMHTALTKQEDGTPTVRFYEYERVRGCVYQIDFFLPDDSKMLFGRMSITNPNPYVVPAYWWSNMAVPEAKGTRTIVPADSTYTLIDGKVALVPVPEYNGIDITYPMNNPIAVDYFFKLSDKARKYEASLDKDGYGLIQTSTSKLVGRKQFVWGQGPGGDRWQKFLTADDSGERYVEIQAGLAHSQYEHLPMPPRTTWAWMEAYGAMQADPAKIHGKWIDARKETEYQLELMLAEQKLEDMLDQTKKAGTSPAEKVIIRGSGWGALENQRRSESGIELLCPHLDFGEVQDEQALWSDMLLGKPVKAQDPCDVPLSWATYPIWTDVAEKYLENNPDTPARVNILTEIAMAYLAAGKHTDAQKLFEEAGNICESPWICFGLSKLAQLRGDGNGSAEYMKRAIELKPDDINIVRQAMKMMTDAGMFKEALALFENIPESVAEDGRVALFHVMAMVRCGKPDEAEEILLRDGGIVIPDIREGEVTLTELWFEIQEIKAKRDGKTFDRNTATPPAKIDFRMQAI